MLAGLIFALAIASPIVASPTALVAIPRLNAHEARAWGMDIRPRQTELMCPTGSELCGGLSCMPTDGSAVCCPEDGSFCPANFRCLPNVCCPMGQACDPNMSIEATTLAMSNGTLVAASQTGSSTGLFTSPMPTSQSTTRTSSSSLSPSSSGPVPPATREVSGGRALTAGWALWPAAAALGFMA
ncbi:hypothetical protein CspHIS471_0407930 [Cutaneotrichosporon sp. HIS471]|nr:hypothetical protein CspHIS471_0407930 [Cutaneotrichosporon sp. HIS471]